MVFCNTTIHQATLADIELAARTTAAAFADYNWTVATVQADGREERFYEINKIFIAEVVLPTGVMFVNDSVSAVSMWSYPASSTTNPILLLGEDLMPRISAIAGDKAKEFIKFDEWLDPYQPKESGFYLGSLAVHPECQGNGLARAVLEPGFALADEGDFPVYLDTSTEDNRRMYEHFGFHVTREVEMPRGAFTSYLMTRPRKSER